MNLRPTLLVTVCLGVLVGCGTSEDPPSGDTGDTSTTTDTGVPTDSEPAPPGDAQRGAAVYEMSCGSGYCHGSDGISGPAPDHPETIPGLTDAELADIVQNGTGSMAPVGLSDTDLQDLVAYLRATFP